MRTTTLLRNLVLLAIVGPVPICLAADVPAKPDTPLQTQLLRAVTVTYALDRSLIFYRDILGQQLMELNQLDTVRSQRYLDIGPRAEVWFASLKGSGEYAGGSVTGGRIAFIGIKDPDARAEDRTPARGRRGRQGDAILPHRVSNLDEIMRRLQRAGFETLVPPTTSSSGLSRSAMVFDPNGKIVELFELFSPPATPRLMVDAPTKDPVGMAEAPATNVR